jgi:predicted lactoylglutathione lyase
MKQLKIVNTKEVNDFIYKVIQRGGYVTSVKEVPPEGVYSGELDEPVTWRINVAWVDPETGERVEIVYA